jgi:hypothetical protein
MGYILITKMKISYKLCINNQQMKQYTLIVYIIHVEFVNIMVNHHL